MGLRNNTYLKELIRAYFWLNYTYKEIIGLLQKEHSIKIGLRTLQRIIHSMNLKRKNIKESPVEDLLAAVIIEKQSCGENLGYRPIWQRLRDKYHLNVKQLTALKILRVVDEDGIRKRSRHRLKRRLYSVPGPNYLWHLDGYDKLKRFGFAIHACVDGFSRFVIWLWVSTTNNKPQVISYYFLDAVKKFKLLPTIMRSDRGTENTNIDILQMVLRDHHTDEFAGKKSFIKGKSTANERIEKHWGQFKRHTAGFYIKLFKDMEKNFVLDVSDPIHIECLRFSFGHLIRNSAKRATKEWNEHRIRSQKNTDVPVGIPNVLYQWPEKVGGEDCSMPVDLDDVENLMQFTEEPKLYEKETEILLKGLMPGVAVPSNPEKAYDLFVKLISALRSLGIVKKKF